MCLKLVVRWSGVILFLFVRLIYVYEFCKSNCIIGLLLIFIVEDSVVRLFMFCEFILVLFRSRSWIIFVLLE